MAHRELTRTSARTYEFVLNTMTSESRPSRAQFLRAAKYSPSRVPGMGGKPTATSFSEARDAFDLKYGRLQALPRSLVPVNGTFVDNVPILTKDDQRLEEYYKWQFIQSAAQSELFPLDQVGCEVHFPKGSKGAKDLIVDAVVFDEASWLDHYRLFKKTRKEAHLQWLSEHIQVVVEFKRGNRPVEEALTRQVRPAMREKEPGNGFVLGIYYDEGRAYLFKREAGKLLRFDDRKNVKGAQSGAGDLSLHLPDPHRFIPSVAALGQMTSPPELDLASRSILDLDVITSIHTRHVRDALSNVLRVLDKAGLTNQRGYEILVQTLALKIFDEKRNERLTSSPLQFFGRPEELSFSKLAEKPVQELITRIDSIRQAALDQYGQILGHFSVDWKNPDHVRVVAAVCENFQDFSFVRSSKSDLYQLVFYNFANRFQQQEKAQFLTPLTVIDFLVKIVAPRGDETVFDPCCGIGDFLSLSFVNAQELDPGLQLTDSNVFGADVSEDMITLASLNMLLNGDGNARLFRVPDLGSVVWKPAGNPPGTVELLPEHHQHGEWDEWPDETRLLKFDVVLTNPPFGEDRSFRPRSEYERQVLEMYQTWALVPGESMDLGVLFLENAYRALNENGRLGIVLSNSIASTSKFRLVREWLLERVRLVAVFDLPANVFAETGVNTTLLVAYKPEPNELRRLLRDGYSTFVRDIKRVGYEKRTSKRNVIFNPSYTLDPATFEIATDGEGNPVLDEEFSSTVADFRNWCTNQEKTLRTLFKP